MSTGTIGFECRRDYAATGNLTNVAVLLELKTMAALDGAFGVSQPVPAFALRNPGSGS